MGPSFLLYLPTLNGTDNTAMPNISDAGEKSDETPTEAVEEIKVESKEEEVGEQDAPETLDEIEKPVTMFKNVRRLFAPKLGNCKYSI